MTDMFTPKAMPFGRPKMGLAAVGTLMTQVASEVADALLCHSFTTPRYLREMTLPLVEAGLAKLGRSRREFRIVGMPFVATGSNDEEIEVAIEGAGRYIAFYCSTPAYVPVLEAEGLDTMHGEMLRLSKEQRWADMGALVDDRLLDTFCMSGRPHEVARQID